MALEHLTTADFDAVTGAAPLAMVDFWASWCGPCKMLTPVMENVSAKYGSRILAAKVNVDDEPELARKFGVMNIPTVVFLKNGREFDRKVGVMAGSAYASVLDQNL
ncbi:MAG: thioredoxin [Oscillibacter sp.]|jgi:thioredoxin 1|nr:thioredoxin [Oscillibacter sp.]